MPDPAKNNKNKDQQGKGNVQTFYLVNTIQGFRRNNSNFDSL
jgi:hypothetical protein